MSEFPYLTIGAAAQQLGCAAWKVRRLFQRGLLPPPPRAGTYRVIPVHDLPAVAQALRKAGYLRPSDGAQP